MKWLKQLFLRPRIYGDLSLEIREHLKEKDPGIRGHVQERSCCRRSAGVAVGIALAFIFTRLLRSLLFGVQPFDPVTFIGVAFLLTLIALAACYLPARRAMRVDPVVALRYE